MSEKWVAVPHDDGFVLAGNTEDRAVAYLVVPLLECGADELVDRLNSTEVK